MKKSNYNVFVQKPNVVLGYNSFTDSYLVLSSKVFENFKNADIEDFEVSFPTHYYYLKENGFIINDELDELAEIRMGYRVASFASRKHYLMIYPTQDCNLKCWYCYESHIKKTIMSKEVQDKIYKHIENKVKNNEFDSLNITFFGGEPLIDFNNVAYPLAKKIKILLEENNKVFTTFFITNGTYIDEEMSHKLNEINAMFQITLDGNKVKHNQVRVRKDNPMPTYDSIINAFHLINKNVHSKLSFTKKVLTLRINYDNDTLEGLSEILTDIDDLDREKVTIHLERIWQTKSNDKGNQLLIDNIILLTEHGFSTGFGLFGKRDVSCPAEVYSYAIFNYDGLVYRCNGRNLTPQSSEGVLMDDGSIKWDRTKLNNRLSKTTFENPLCIKCKMLPMCMGPCSQKSIEHDWNMDKSICSLKAVDFSLQDYLTLDYRVRTILLNTDYIKV